MRFPNQHKPTVSLTGFPASSNYSRSRRQSIEAARNLQKRLALVSVFTKILIATLKSTLVLRSPLASPAQEFLPSWQLVWTGSPTARKRQQIDQLEFARVRSDCRLFADDGYETNQRGRFGWGFSAVPGLFITQPGAGLLSGAFPSSGFPENRRAWLHRGVVLGFRSTGNVVQPSGIWGFPVMGVLPNHQFS